MARPKIEIDISRVEELAAQGLTQVEICLCLGISPKTLERRKVEMSVLTDAINRGKAKAASEVANVLYLKATKDRDLGAIIWYEKTRRGLSDRQAVEHSGPEGRPIAIEFNYHAVATEITSGSSEDSETPG
jgi:hypothetical protein